MRFSGFIFAGVTRLALIAGLGAVAAAPLRAQSVQPTIANLTPGIRQADGSYLWEYRVEGGARPALSTFTIGICPQTAIFDDVKTALVPGSVEVNGRSARYEFRSVNQPDPVTGGVGLKIDGLGGADNSVYIVSFRLFRRFEPGTVEVWFKSGTQLTSQTTTGIACQLGPPPPPPPPAIPEPATLALLASAGIPALLARRRSHRNRQ
jgi:hypothetical protein